MDTLLLQAVLFVPGESLYIFSQFNPLIRMQVNADNGHLFLAQSTNSHRKQTSLMQTLHYQLYRVIDLSFFKIKNLELTLTACPCSQHYDTPDKGDL